MSTTTGRSTTVDTPTTEHGYNRYTHGCRCQPCTAWKADSDRARKQVA